jgi:cytoskeletal protein RodZ
MDFRNALKVIKHHLAVFLVVTGMFAGVTGTVGAWLWKEYRDLQQQIAQFEQRKSEVAEVQNNRELELKNREYIAGQIESNYTERAKALKARELEL